MFFLLLLVIEVSCLLDCKRTFVPHRISASGNCVQRVPECDFACYVGNLYPQSLAICMTRHYVYDWFCQNDGAYATPVKYQKISRALKYEEIFCSDEKDCELLKPFYNFETRHMLAPKYGISTCVIYKNFSTVFTSIICYLFDAIAYKKEVPDMMKDTYFNRRCQLHNEVHGFGIKKEFKSERGNRWRNYVILREPEERFVSAFVDKCIFAKKQPEAHYYERVNPCYGCETNITCFIEKQYESLRAIANGTKQSAHTVEDAHFAPQTWHCEMKEFFTDYTFLKYTPSKTSALLDELFAEFEFFGVPRNITDDIRKQIIGRKTFHVTYDSDLPGKYRQEIRNSRYLREMLVKLYYFDYLYFHFPLPNLR
ncbi:unnamed protein product, partial [Mesorhabditis belari]|uniref:Uncharacterized protein n=1 Tax=Mesorhabditis belari TaxID=2138241 RepID=A0AAF3FL72_9BILA